MSLFSAVDSLDDNYHFEDSFLLEPGDSQEAIVMSTSSKNDQPNNIDAENSEKAESSSFYCVDIWQMTSPSEIAAKLALMSQAPRICFEMRNDGVLPLLVQFLHQHSTEDGMLTLSSAALDSGGQCQQPSSETFQSTLALRRNSAKALRNIVSNTSTNRKEVEILCLLEDLRSFVEIFYLRWSDMPVEAVDHPCSLLAEIFAFACDSSYRKMIELYGGIYVIFDVIQSDFRFHRAGNTNDQCFLLRQYSLNVLTYMTAQNETVKSVLGSMRPFIGMLVETLQQAPQLGNLQLLQSVANVLHNLSWKSDFNSKQIMRDFNTVYYLAKMAMETTNLKALKALLEPLLNLTAHCTPNKIDFCKVEGVLDFLISKLKANILPSFSSTSQLNPTELAIVENSSGILRNISPYLVTQEDLIEQLRAQNIVAILLEQLKAASLAIVSNVCITLSYLAAHSSKDAFKIKELGGIQILHGLTNSKHEPIKLGASKTLQHLFTSHLTNSSVSFKNTPTMSASYSIPSSLQFRKLKAFKTEIHSFLSENFDTLQCDPSPNGSPEHLHSCNRNSRAANLNDSAEQPEHYRTAPNKVIRSSSHDSIGSTHSEPVSKRSLMYQYHRRSMQPASVTAANHKSGAAIANAALQNLTAKSGIGDRSSQHHNQRMIHSYSGQTLSSLYATLPASIRERDLMVGESACALNDAASDYDISICDISGSSLTCPPPLPPLSQQRLGKSRNTASTSTITKSSSSTPDYLEEREEREEDPAPTDYSQRFKEQVIDDFSTPQSASKNDTGTGEDTVKVYQTENTPLAFSLAPSLSDLRDVAETNSALNHSDKLMRENGIHKMNNLSERFGALELNKPIQEEKLLKKSFLTSKPPINQLSSLPGAHNNKFFYFIKENAAINHEKELNDNERQHFKDKTGIAKSMSSHESLKYCGPRKNSKIIDEKSGKQYTRSSSMSAIMCDNDNNYDHSAIVNTKCNNDNWAEKTLNVQWACKIAPIVSSSVSKQADLLEHFATSDSAQSFATENTPAIFSHATSLSSLSIDDDDSDDFANEQQRASVSDSTSQTHRTNAISRTSSFSSSSTTSHQKSSQVNNNAATAAQQSQSKSPLPKMSVSISNSPFVKTTPYAVKKISNRQTIQQMSKSTTSVKTVQSYNNKNQQLSSLTSPGLPNKPLPLTLLDESSSPRTNASLLPASTITSVLPIDDDDDYDDFMFKCRQLVMPKKTQVKLKSHAKTSSTIKQNDSSSRVKLSHNNKNNKSTPFLHEQSNSSVQVATSNQINLTQLSDTQNVLKPGAKNKHISNSKSNKNAILNATQLKQQSANASKDGKNAFAELSDFDENDDLLLTQCMQIAINKQSHSCSKPSSKKASIRHSNFFNRECKYPQIQKKVSASTTVLGKNNQHHTGQESMLPLKETPSLIEQSKHFYVEDTPVQNHTPFSSLSVESGDEVKNHKLIKTAIQSSSELTQKSANETVWVNPGGQCQEMSETESESATVTLTMNNAAAIAAVAMPQSSSYTHVRSSSRANQEEPALSTLYYPEQQQQQQQRQVLPGTTRPGKSTKLSSNRNNSENARNPQRQTAINNRSTKSASSSASGKPFKSTTKKRDAIVEKQQNNSTNSGRLHKLDSEQHFSSLEDADDDERTYTICTQSSRHSSATLAYVSNQLEHNGKKVNPPALVMSYYSSSGSVNNIEGENPPSLVDDHNLMFSSTETNMTRSGLKFIPLQQPRATSARTRKTAGTPLDDKLQSPFTGQQPHSLEEHLASSLENQKPPSIMEHSFFMSQSTASITSEISDIALDQVPVRKSSTELVAEMASNYAKEITNLADQLCFTGTVLVSMEENTVSLSPLSSPTDNSKRLAAVKSTNPLIEQRSDQTFDMEPSPTPRTNVQSLSSKTNTGTTTVRMAGTSSNTRTYNKTDKTKNTNTTEKTLKPGGEENVADSDDSDTDISENLPLDDVHTKEMLYNYPTKSTPLQPTMPVFNHPMDSLKRDKKPSLTPQYKSHTKHHSSSHYELTDDSSEDEQRRLHLSYSQSLNNRRVPRSTRKNAKNLNPVFVQQESGNPQYGSFDLAEPSNVEQTNPYSNHHQIAFNSLDRQSNSSRVKNKKNFENKNTAIENSAQIFQNESNTTQNVENSSKYSDCHATLLNSIVYKNQFQMGNQVQSVYESAIPIPSSKRSGRIDSNKSKENKNLNKEKKKEKESSFLYKISSSFSSHNIGAHATNSGQSTPTTPLTPTSTKTSFNKINSKFASFWKRSKSSHDKLDQNASKNQNINMKTAKINKNISFTRSNNKPDNLDSNKKQTGLPRSSTYEKLPVNEKEVAQMNSFQLKDKNNDNNANCSIKQGICAQQSCNKCTGLPAKNPILFDNANDQASESHLHQFTFTTFVKTPSSSIHPSSEQSLSTQFSATQMREKAKHDQVCHYQHQQQQTEQQHKVATGNSAETVTMLSDHTTVVDSLVEETSGISSESPSSNQPSRKTCLVSNV